MQPPADRRQLNTEFQSKDKVVDTLIPSAHPEPNNQSTQSKPFEELHPGQAVGIKRKHPHHQVEQLFVHPDQRRAIRGVQLRQLL